MPTVPGSDGCLVNRADEAAAFADEVGWPVLIKATAGGGGKGMREVHDPADLAAQYAAAQQRGWRRVRQRRRVPGEARAAPAPRGGAGASPTTYGNVVALCERDCSVQRRHQKLIEESALAGADRGPAPRHDGGGHDAPCAAVDYTQRRHHRVSAGRALDVLLHGDEHARAGGAPGHRADHRHRHHQGAAAHRRRRAHELRAIARRSRTAGHAIECRINAEDPEHGFLPSPRHHHADSSLPAGPGVRVETLRAHAARASRPTTTRSWPSSVVHGQDRAEAVARGQAARSDEFVIEGIADHDPVPSDACSTTRCSWPGDATTDFIETQMGDVL